ncbi:DUF268 domain-containing protein [Methylobacterium sp. 391_Methyba4]|uniref:DUF268 domain-containing protein n=1 Tax=Methylobacterium sp. 391_Methyba4 TaxID=3038924 RepID=UPI00241E2451|nr:DUF268 domain-containing protein [Methylobacterium sp. 391_Methyba4]WFS09106.1 DUF268 domain-containing protein [Methylobacterium sp. 391_Methyba4]
MFFRKRKRQTMLQDTAMIAAEAITLPQERPEVPAVDPAVARYEDDRRKLIAGLEGTHDWPFGVDYPILNEWDQQSGTASGHYFHQDLWAARRIYQRSPNRHVDVGSRIDGFVAHVASYREVEIFDIRPLNVNIPNIIFQQHDFLQKSLTSICDSLSCLHALEHFGLGRYGDPVDARGYIEGFANISALLSDGGTFYFSVPIGRQRIEFNAHRIFSLKAIIELYETHRFQLREFSYVDDRGGMNYDVKLTNLDISRSLGLDYGCGLFELVKI